MQERTRGLATAVGSAGESEWAEPQLLRPYVPLTLHIGYVRMRSVVDRVVAALLLVVAAPVMAVVAIAVAVDSGFPILFRQERVGQFEKPFSMLKFRSMVTTAPKYSEKVSAQDRRITRVGRVIRVTCLDELPQLINVVRGDMALIGPRPEQLPLLSEYTLEGRQRHQIKPGVTGWWQVHHRDDVPLRLNVDKDLYYVEHQGLMLDLRILLMTAVLIVKAMQGIGAREPSGPNSHLIMDASGGAPQTEAEYHN